jgi:hypothetical protein
MGLPLVTESCHGHPDNLIDQQERSPILAMTKKPSRQTLEVRVPAGLWGDDGDNLP